LADQVVPAAKKTRSECDHLRCEAAARQRVEFVRASTSRNFRSTASVQSVPRGTPANWGVSAETSAHHL